MWRIALFPVAKADSKPLSKITRSFVMGPEGGRTVIVLQELETCAGRLLWGAVGRVGEDGAGGVVSAAEGVDAAGSCCWGVVAGAWGARTLGVLARTGLGTGMGIGFVAIPGVGTGWAG